MEIKNMSLDELVKDFTDKHTDQKHAYTLSWLENSKPFKVMIFQGELDHSVKMNQLLVDMKENPDKYVIENNEVSADGLLC